MELNFSLSAWTERLGGATLLAVVAVPWVWAGLIGADGRGAAVLLLVVPILLIALLAPLVGERRLCGLWMLLPLYNVYVAWEFGVRLTRLGHVAEPSEDRPLIPRG